MLETKAHTQKKHKKTREKYKALKLKKTLDDSCISQKAFDLKSKIETLYRSSI
jgi:hypothetical protein